MKERLGLLFADDSILVLPDGVDAEGAWREADDYDWGEIKPRTQVVRLKLEIVGDVARPKEHD